MHRLHMIYKWCSFVCSNLKYSNWSPYIFCEDRTVGFLLRNEKIEKEALDRIFLSSYGAGLE